MRERIVPTVCEGVLGDDKITIRHSILLPAVSEARPQEAIGRSTTQGIFCVRGAISPLLANLFLHYAFDAWMTRTFAHIPFERYADDSAPRRREGEASM